MLNDSFSQNTNYFMNMYSMCLSNDYVRIWHYMYFKVSNFYQ